MERRRLRWSLATLAGLAILMGGYAALRPSPSADERMARLDEAIAAAIQQAESGDVEGARSAIPSWSRLNIEYMRVLFREMREISDKHGSPNCATAGRGIRTHLGDAKRTVAAWRIEMLGNDARRLADAMLGAIAQTRIVGELAVRHARRCTVRPGDYSSPVLPWVVFLNETLPYPELQAAEYLKRIMEAESESLRRDG